MALPLFPVTFWIEPENFPELDHWKSVKDVSGVRCVAGAEDGKPLPKERATDKTVITVPGGVYRLWVRAKDFAKNQQGTRRSKVEINGSMSAVEFGTHGNDGFAWQFGGEYTIPAGECRIGIFDSTSFYAKIDKIMLTTDASLVPAGEGEKENVSHKPRGLDDAANVKDGITIDASFPGGNVIVDRRSGDKFFIRQDIRDNAYDWFYWCFRIRGAAGKTIAFKLTGSSAIGFHGPAASADGKRWRWLGKTANNEFSYSFSNEQEMYFSCGMPYTRRDLIDFIDALPRKDVLRLSVLTNTKRGTPVDLVRMGNEKSPDHIFFITARHHACEMMASYVIEGIIETYCASSAEGEWLRSRTACSIVPFVDTDGVERGDQGKGRAPQDHNLDYRERGHIYPEIAAIQSAIRALPAEKVTALIDIHCPGLFGSGHEHVYQVGQSDASHWKRQEDFAAVLERTIHPSLPYRATNDMAVGTGWVPKQSFQNKFGAWGASNYSCLVTTFEIPYARAEEAVVDQSSARAFGRRMVLALCAYARMIR